MEGSILEKKIMLFIQEEEKMDTRSLPMMKQISCIIISMYGCNFQNIKQNWIYTLQGWNISYI